MVHLSDIHFSEAYYMPEIADSMIENINRSAPNIVIITGDLTENGLAAEYKWSKKFHQQDRMQKQGNSSRKP